MMVKLIRHIYIYKYSIDKESVLKIYKLMLLLKGFWKKEIISYETVFPWNCLYSIIIDYGREKMFLSNKKIGNETDVAEIFKSHL